MKIYIANDHGGYNLKKKLMNYLDCSFKWNPSEKSNMFYLLQKQPRNETAKTINDIIMNG